MSNSKIAVVGSGVAGSTLAYLLTAKGHEVDVFEKGPDYPYPHARQFEELATCGYDNPSFHAAPDIQGLTLAGDYPRDLNKERSMRVGGSATRWQAISLRMLPDDFRTKTLFGYGDDWPLTYVELEPYYGRAEALLGVSGTDADNPFAPPRSKPHPLPQFELSYDDMILKERLGRENIVLHTTPQARVRSPYQDRSACVNFGVCNVCPTGARYSPNHHLALAVKTGLCKVRSGTSVRKIIVDVNGKADGIIYRRDSGGDTEHHAGTVIVAGGAIESARLLLLSADERRPNGLGNSGGHVGRNLTFHHLWRGRIRYKDKLFPGRFGGWTGQSHQFLAPPTRGRHGGVKVEFSSHAAHTAQPQNWRDSADALRDLAEMRNWRSCTCHAESIPTAQKFMSLSDKRDRYGDPLAHVQYESGEFDHETYRFAGDIFKRFVSATKGDDPVWAEFSDYDSGAHHMGTCRMGESAKESVVDAFCKVHGTDNLYVVGAGAFIGGSGAVNPTLTLTALAVRTADYIIDGLGAT